MTAAAMLAGDLPPAMPSSHKEAPPFAARPPRIKGFSSLLVEDTTAPADSSTALLGGPTPRTASARIVSAEYWGSTPRQETAGREESVDRFAYYTGEDLAAAGLLPSKSSRESSAQPPPRVFNLIDFDACNPRVRDGSLEAPALPPVRRQPVHIAISTPVKPASGEGSDPSYSCLGRSPEKGLQPVSLEASVLARLPRPLGTPGRSGRRLCFPWKGKAPSCSRQAHSTCCTFRAKLVVLLEVSARQNLYFDAFALWRAAAEEGRWQSASSRLEQENAKIRLKISKAVNLMAQR